MAEAKSAPGFFRKMARFVANPTADWAATPQSAASQLDRSELKEIVERKRRNDFVRRREFDTLRRLRREGLSPEKLAALGGSSKAADSEVRATEHDVLSRGETGVKAKIDAIEQQMAGEGGRREAPSRAAPPASTLTPSRAHTQIAAPARIAADPIRMTLRPDIDLSDPAPPPSAQSETLSLSASRWPALRDPELDEAAIAFANADFDHCEQVLSAMCRPTAARHRDGPSWHVLLDLYRATGQQPKFDKLAMDYALLFGRSSPPWYSLPKRVADAAASLPLSIVSDLSSGFLAPTRPDDSLAARQVCTVELSGQLSGDISAQLQQIDRQLGSARGVQVSCAKLIRVDFIAAGDLLNWVLAKQAEQRSVSFIDAHRLLALFFGAMGLDEHVKVSIPRD
jgi:ABC-type transporter Mla MlaB component